ncbi:MAG: type VI secretion system baseplate subunit TssF [Desulfobacteraceae bacterium]|nr:type VI secretion system baseplate subunit TssF [Desulfobacteraceae bacterium]MBC2754357.1 type VI secretion system baseplate subunit TssF [Desulfobacteraceae bacterium]
MLNRYFQQEISNLKELGAEFSQAHPAIAPMLSGPSADPDVERLLEGVAFLTALLRQKLDDEFPEIIHELVHLIWPHYLRPVPSTTIIEFTPKPTLKQSLQIPAGVHIASVPVDGTPCLFQTCYDVDVHPIKLLDASFKEKPGRPPVISIQMELQGPQLSAWDLGHLRLYLAGDFSNAADLYSLLSKNLRQIIISPIDDGESVILSSDDLRPVGFSNNESLFPYPPNSFPGYRILQEYFVLPSKFLFLDLFGWDRWKNRGDGNRFEIQFEFGDLPFLPSKINKFSFLLSASPAINIFGNEADPIRLDHRKTDYLVRPSGQNTLHYQVYSVEKVAGFVQGTAKEKIYTSFDMFSSGHSSNPVYYTRLRHSPVHPGLDVYLSFAYPSGAELQKTEIISTKIQCTNANLPEGLQVGDISQPTSTSPELVTFKNISPPTNNILPPLGKNLLWRLLSHLSLNYLSLSNEQNLKAILDLYIFEETRDKTAFIANRKRISGIEKVETKGSDRLVSSIIMRGQDIVMKVRQDHFTGPGDLYLFGSIMDHFLGNYASINTYTRLSITETVKGDVYQWPARLGVHPLI